MARISRVTHGSMTAEHIVHRLPLAQGRHYELLSLSGGDYSHLHCYRGQVAAITDADKVAGVDSGGIV